jgi:hypothetical protein
MTNYGLFSTDDFINVSELVKTRADYLAWVQEWRVRYAALAHEIRTLKAARSPFTYAYRGRDESNELPKRTKIGENVSYDPSANNVRMFRREEADMLMQARSQAKAMGIARMMAEREAETAAA